MRMSLRLAPKCANTVNARWIYIYLCTCVHTADAHKHHCNIYHLHALPSLASYLRICNHCKHNLVRSFHHIYTNIHTHIYRICRLHPLCTTLYIQPWWEGILCALAGNMYIHCNCKHKECKCTKNDMLNSFHI